MLGTTHINYSNTVLVELQDILMNAEFCFQDEPGCDVVKLLCLLIVEAVLMAHPESLSGWRTTTMKEMVGALNF